MTEMQKKSSWPGHSTFVLKGRYVVTWLPVYRWHLWLLSAVLLPPERQILTQNILKIDFRNVLWERKCILHVNYDYNYYLLIIIIINEFWWETLNLNRTLFTRKTPQEALTSWHLTTTDPMMLYDLWEL